MNKQVEIGISEWVENLQSQGKYAFSLTMLQNQLPGLSDIAVKSALSRLTIKDNQGYKPKENINHLISNTRCLPP